MIIQQKDDRFIFLFFELFLPNRKQLNPPEKAVIILVGRLIPTISCLGIFLQSKAFESKNRTHFFASPNSTQSLLWKGLAQIW